MFEVYFITKPSAFVSLENERTAESTKALENALIGRLKVLGRVMREG